MNNRETFCLRWNEFETNIRESFRELREDKNYFDVTLASDDGQLIQAHKIILSAGSKFFNEILKKADHPSPFIHLKGIDKTGLGYVVDFLYNGETNLPQEDLTGFLETAQELQIKGLQNNMEDREGRTQNLSNQYEEEQPNFQDKRGSEQNSSIDQGLLDTFDNSETDIVQTNDEQNYVNDSNLELDLQIEQLMVKEDRAWKCTVCGEISNEKAKIKRHTEKHIQGMSNMCNLCSKTFATRHSLQTHNNNIHCNSLLTCNICGKTGMNKMTFQNHKYRMHKI